MTHARAVEYRITRNLLQQRSGAGRRLPPAGVVERLICSIALAAAMLLFGSFVPELLGVLVAASLVLALGG